MRYFLNPIETADIVEGINAWTQTSVKTEYLIVDESGQRKVVEEVCEVFPDVGVAIFPQAFVVEAVDLSDLAGFVVSS